MEGNLQGDTKSESAAVASVGNIQAEIQARVTPNKETSGK